jgi:hypothetical protein
MEKMRENLIFIKKKKAVGRNISTE